MISMTQFSGHRANSASGADEIGVGHSGVVRIERTFVNVESVRSEPDYGGMANKTLGDRLRSLQAQSGLSYDTIAVKAGYRGRSSVQRYFAPDYDADYLPLAVAKKLAKGFAGTSVSQADIMALAGYPEGNASIQKYEGAADVTLRRDLPIYGTALGAPEEFSGEAIEQTMLNRGEIIDYAKRPTVLNDQQHAYGLYVQGVSMSPRFDDGELIFVTHGLQARPPRIGDDVVVYMRDEGSENVDSATGVMVKRLIRRNSDFVELQQFTPALTFRLDAARIFRIDRVIPWSELLS